MFVLLWTPLCELAVLKEEASLVAKSTSTLESPPSSQKHPQRTQWHRNNLEVLCFIPFLPLLKFLAGPGTHSLFFSTLHIFFFLFCCCYGNGLIIFLFGAHWAGNKPQSRNRGGVSGFFSKYFSFSVIYIDDLRHLIFIKFHNYLPCYLSKYNLRILFDRYHCQNIQSHSQNCCFKKWKTHV